MKHACAQLPRGKISADSPFNFAYQVHFSVLDIKLSFSINITRASIAAVIYLQRHHRHVGVQVVLHVCPSIPYLGDSVTSRHQAVSYQPKQ